MSTPPTKLKVVGPVQHPDILENLEKMLVMAKEGKILQMGVVFETTGGFEQHICCASTTD